MKRMIHYRWWIIVFVLAFTLVLSGSLFKIEVDPDLRGYFPDNMESMVNTERIESIFGNQDMLLIVFAAADVIRPATLNRIKEIDKRLGRLVGVKKTSSLFSANHIYAEEGIMFVEPAVERIPESAVEMANLKESLSDNAMVNGIVVAEDFHSASIILNLDDGVNEDTLFNRIQSIIEEIPGDEQIHFGGLPYLRQEINQDIQRDGLILIPIALLLMLLFLFAVFREKRGVLLPFTVVLLSTIAALALLPLLGWSFTLITLLVPIMLVAIANDYGIHMIAKYQEINATRGSIGMKEISSLVAEKLWKPVLLTGLTTIAGISALLSHTMIPARQMAVIAAFGIALALFYSIILIPVLLSLMKRSHPLPLLRKMNSGIRHTFLGRLALFVRLHYNKIPWFAILITFMLGSGILFLNVDSNEENFFPERHPVKEAAAIINRDYGGSETLSVLFSGDLFDPALLMRMDGYKSSLLEREDIDLVISFPDVIREISKAINDPGSPYYDVIPNDRFAIAQYIELYNMSGSQDAIDQVVDFNYEHAHMLIRISNASNTAINSVIRKLKSMTSGDENMAAIGGYGYVRAQLANKVVTGQFYSLAIAMLLVMFLLALIFRSITAGILGILPLLLSVIVLFGIMGIFDIKLDIATALLSSVMIGVGVDYTIHFLWRYRSEVQSGLSPPDAVGKTLTTTGRGIVFNALSVIVGFVVLIFSSFTPIRFFGILIVVSILTCLSGALILLPALIIKFRFKFLESPSTSDSDEKSYKNAV